MYDFRSDTVTTPTAAMMAAIAAAPVGDSARGDDPTHNRLEARSAELIGKDAALFLPSGTMCNLAAILTHTHAGNEVIVEARAHIYNAEAGGMSAVAGTVPRPVPGENGILRGADVAGAIRPRAVAGKAATGLICLENTLNAAGGTVLPDGVSAEIRAVADAAGLKVHLDGARLFNAAAFLDTPVDRLCRDADSVMVALSKGLGAPMGSILAGDKGFIDAARHNARMLGGGMRQTGMMAAAALVALEDPFPALRRDHELASLLGAGLVALDPSLVRGPIQTNIVNCHVDRFAGDATRFVASLAEHGVLANFAGNTVRFVTHRHIDRDAVTACVKAAARGLDNLRKVA